MIFPKKQAQRLIPEYLLDYTTKLNESHPDPTESWGGGSGGSYTSGDGITINDNVISVDNTIARKSEIPTKTSDLTNDSGYITSITSSDITTALGYTPGTSNFSGSYNDLTDKPTIPTNYVTTDTIQTINITKYFGGGTLVVDDGAYTLSHYTDMFKFSDGTGIIDFQLPIDKTKGNVQVPAKYTLATIDDIPNVPTLATVATTGSYNDLIDKPTLATVATSGSFNDLIDKPTIPDTTNFVTTDTNQAIRGLKTFDSAKLSVEKLTPIRTKLTFRPNMFMYYAGDSVAYFNLPTSKPKGTVDAPTEYTLATTDDIVDATNFVTLDTAQTITGAKTFQGGPICSSLGGAYTMQPLGVGVLRFNDVNSTKQIDFSLPIEKSGTDYTIATTDDIHNPTITFTQGGTTKGTITLNQSGDQTIALDAGGSSGGGKLYLHKITIKKAMLYDENDVEVGHLLWLYNNITTSSNQPMTLDTYKQYFTDILASDYGFATSGKVNINSSGNSSIISISFNNNLAGINYFYTRNGSSNTSYEKIKFDSVDLFDDIVTEV